MENEQISQYVFWYMYLFEISSRTKQIFHFQNSKCRQKKNKQKPNNQEPIKPMHAHAKIKRNPKHRDKNKEEEEEKWERNMQHNPAVTARSFWTSMWG